MQEVGPLNESEVKDNSAERRKLEARIELFENRLTELSKERGSGLSRKAETSEQKKLRTAIAKVEAALKKL